MKQAALGFRVHSGWAAMVAVHVEKNVPRVLARDRVQLVETFTYRFRQPYHTAEKLPLAEAREFVKQVEAEAAKLAYRAIQRAQSNLEKEGIRVTHCALLLASGKTLPNFENILASHAMIHTADGALFREALLCAAKRCGLETAGIKERELLELAKQKLRIQPGVLLRRLTELGKSFGSPWSQDEKLATLAAWMALGSGTAARQERRKEGKD